MPSSNTSRRQRVPHTPPAFSSPLNSTFLGYLTIRSARSPALEPPHFNSDLLPRHTLSNTPFNTCTRPCNRPAARSTAAAVTAPSPAPMTPPPLRTRSRYSEPVPPAKPHEIMPHRRGRDSRRRVQQAEQFRKYIHLRRQLKPWSDKFREKHGRTPSLIDVDASGVPGLLDRFVEYLEALEGLRFGVNTDAPKKRTPLSNR